MGKESLDKEYVPSVVGVGLVDAATVVALVVRFVVEGLPVVPLGTIVVNGLAVGLGEVRTIVAGVLLTATSLLSSVPDSWEDTPHSTSQSGKI